MKTVQWRSEEKQLEVLTRTKEPQDCMEKFLNDHHGKPALIQLTSGEQIPCVLVGCELHGHGLLIVRRKTAELHIVRITHIESIGVT